MWAFYLIRTIFKISGFGREQTSTKSRLTNYLQGHYSLCYSLCRKPNNAWNNKAHSSTAETHFVLIASNDICDTHTAHLGVTSEARGFPLTRSPPDTRTSLCPQAAHRKYSTRHSRSGTSHSLEKQKQEII